MAKLSKKAAEKMIGKMGGMPGAKKGSGGMMSAYKKADKAGDLGKGFGGEPSAAQDKMFMSKQKAAKSKVAKKKVIKK